MSETPKCGLCGEPMPTGEEMFRYHGYSGPCPTPPKPSAVLEDRCRHEWGTMSFGPTFCYLCGAWAGDEPPPPKPSAEPSPLSLLSLFGEVMETGLHADGTQSRVWQDGFRWRVGFDNPKWDEEAALDFSVLVNDFLDRRAKPSPAPVGGTEDSALADAALLAAVELYAKHARRQVPGTACVCRGCMDIRAALRSRSTGGAWQRCPICNGRGRVDGNFYMAGGSSSTANVQCRTCAGVGVVVAPLDSLPAVPEESKP